MKKFISRVQNLSQRAAELKAALETAPAKVAELRETVASTTGQLMQLRADAQATIHGLRTDSEDRLTEALREVDAGTEVLHEAGYVIDDVEMELGVAQRLVVHLEKMEDVPHAVLRHLMAANQSKKSLHAILAALIKAEELADRVSLTQLHYHKLTVYVGLAPSMRVCWCPEPAAASGSTAPAPLAAPLGPAVAPSAFAQSTYFERRTPMPANVAAPTVSQHTDSAMGTQAEPVVAPAAPAEGGDPLARFKRMPDLTKFRR